MHATKEATVYYPHCEYCMYFLEKADVAGMERGCYIPTVNIPLTKPSSPLPAVNSNSQLPAHTAEWD